MSQSATLYRVSQDIFRQLEESENDRKFEISSAKNYTTFQGTFMGLEYILSKGQDESMIRLVNEIFNPSHSLGGHDFENLSFEEQFEFYESDNLIPYLDTSTISNLNDFLDSVTEAEIRFKYDPNEFNDNGIYPEIWHNDNSPDKGFNERELLKDLSELKSIIQLADKEKDYIFVFVG